MDNILSIAEDEWLLGDFARVIERLERDQYSALESISDEQVLTLLVRIHKEREALLTFLNFLDRFISWYRSRNPVVTNYRLERFVSIAPILRRDTLTVVPGNTV